MFSQSMFCYNKYTNIITTDQELCNHDRKMYVIKIRVKPNFCYVYLQSDKTTHLVKHHISNKANQMTQVTGVTLVKKT